MTSPFLFTGPSERCLLVLTSPFHRPEEVHNRIDNHDSERHERECRNDLVGAEQWVVLHVAVEAGLLAVAIRGEPLENRNDPVR